MMNGVVNGDYSTRTSVRKQHSPISLWRWRRHTTFYETWLCHPKTPSLTSESMSLFHLRPAITLLYLIRRTASFAASLVLQMAYGYQMAPKDDRLVAHTESTVEMLTGGISGAGAIVNAFPTRK